MSPQELVIALSSAVVDEGIQFHELVLRNTERAEATDHHYSAAFHLYDSLSNEDKGVLTAVIRQALVDGLSLFLGILDGTSTIAGLTEELSLRTEEAPNERLDGYLQDIYLEMIEKGEL